MVSFRLDALNFGYHNHIFFIAFASYSMSYMNKDIEELQNGNECEGEQNRRCRSHEVALVQMNTILKHFLMVVRRFNKSQAFQKMLSTNLCQQTILFFQYRTGQKVFLAARFLGFGNIFMTGP